MPDHALRAQQREYQTEIIKTLMDHLLAADVLLGEQAALPIAMGGSYANMANNVFYFASRVVDKLWQGSCLFIGFFVFAFLLLLSFICCAYPVKEIETHAYIYFQLCMYLPTPPHEQDVTQDQFFKSSLPEPNLSYYLPIAEGRIV